MFKLALNGVLGPTGRDKDAEQKQGLDLPANGQLTNKKGAAVCTGAHLQALRPTKAKQSLRGQTPSTAVIPKTKGCRVLVTHGYVNMARESV